MQNDNDAMKTSEDTSLEKYTSHFISKGSKGLLKILLCERWVGGWTELQHIDPTLLVVTTFLSRSPGLLNRGPGGPASLGHVPHSSIFSPTATAQSGAWGCPLCWVLVPSTASYLQLTDSLSSPGLYNCSTPTFFLWASQIALNSTAKAISWYSSTGCTCYLHRCISYFYSLAGVNMLQVELSPDLLRSWVYFSLDPQTSWVEFASQMGWNVETNRWETRWCGSWKQDMFIDPFTMSSSPSSWVDCSVECYSSE